MGKEIEKGCLAELLRQAERELGKAKTPNWPERYAEYMVDQRGLYFLGCKTGKAVQEILNRYVGELEERVGQIKAGPFPDADELARDDEKDIDYITGLAKLFD